MQGFCSSFLCFCLHFYVFFFSFFPLALSSKWSPEDDQQLLEVVRIVGLGNWPRGRKGKHFCLHILNFFFFFFLMVFSFLIICSHLLMVLFLKVLILPINVF